MSAPRNQPLTPDRQPLGVEMEVFCSATDCAQITTQPRPCAMYARDMALCPSFAVHSHRGVLGRCHLSFCQRCTCTGIFCHQCLQVTFLTRDPPLTDPIKTAEVSSVNLFCMRVLCARAQFLRASGCNVVVRTTESANSVSNLRADDRAGVDRAFSRPDPSAQGAT